MRALAFLLAATAISLVGCAEVRAPSGALAPTAGSFSAPESLDASLAAEAPSPSDDLEPVAYDGDEEDADEDEGEDEHEHDDIESEEIDILACLDRGPGLQPSCPQYTWKPSPLQGLSQSEIEQKVKTDLASLGPISLGYPNRGRLFNGVQMPESDKWAFTERTAAYGTQETIDSIARAIEKVHAKHPNSDKVIIGHLSTKSGGRLKPHKSHQAGRDVDLSYFYTEKVGWYAYATDKNLDRARTWTFVKAFLEDPNTEMVLVDTSIQKMLYDFALKAGEDKEFLDKAFQIAGKNPRAIVRHVAGHATHIHARFFSPSAQATGRLAEAYLPKPPPPPPKKRGKGKHVAKGDDTEDTKHAKKAKSGGDKKPKDEDAFVYHRARSGDTLDSLARHYGVSIQAIRQANGLKGNALKQKQTYRIPKPEKTASASAPGGQSKSGRPRK